MSDRSKIDTRDQDVKSPRLAHGGKSESDPSENTTTTSSQTPGQRNLGKTANVFQSASKRSRRLSVITPQACTTCRRKRSKCDGQSPCERCKRENTKCVYETIVRHSKNKLRAELNGLRERQRLFERVFAALVHPTYWETALARLRSGQLDESEWLDLEWLSNGSFMSSDPTSPASARLGANNFTAVKCQPLGDNQVNTRKHVYSMRLRQPTQNNLHSIPPIALGQIHSMHNNSQSKQATSSYSGFVADGKLNAHNNEHKALRDRRWTSITGDNELIQHLLALYFCWEYPNFAPISKEHFLRDFHSMRPRYCSSMLVNALLALACHLSSRPIATTHSSNLHSLGDDFFAEWNRLFHTEADHHRLTTIQALVIISAREARCSRVPASKYYAELGMRLAVEMGLHASTAEEHEDEHAVLSKTFWGTYALNQAWSMMTSTLPQCSYALALPPKPAITVDVETSSWVPYIDGDAHLLPHIQLSNVRSVYRCFCNLSELIHESQYLLYSPTPRFTGAALLQNYYRYLDWYAELPDVMRLGHNSTPAVLFTHLYYHFAVLLLFRRFIKMQIIGSQVSPREVCIQSAHAIQSLVSSYTKLYTLRRTPSLMPFFIFASAIPGLFIGARAVQNDPTKSTIKPPLGKTFEQSIASLTETAPYHPFAKRALCVLRHFAHKWNVNLDVEKSRATFDGYISGANQGTGNIESYAPDFEIIPWDGESNVGKGVSCGDEAVKVECNMETLWPVLFWFQDRTTLPDQEDLAQTGFATIDT